MTTRIGRFLSGGELAEAGNVERRTNGIYIGKYKLPTEYKFDLYLLVSNGHEKFTYTAKPNKVVTVYKVGVSDGKTLLEVREKQNRKHKKAI